MDPFSKHLSSLKAHQKYLGAACPSIQWPPPPGPSNNYPCIAGSLKLGKDLGPGGFKTSADLEIDISSDVFPPTSQPTLRQSIVYLNQVYRIDSIEVLPGGVIWRMQCNDPNRAA